MIDAKRKAELTAAGYFIEDMELEYGREFKGQFRWMNSLTDEFQDSHPSYGVEEAWTQAHLHQEMVEHV